MAYSFASASSQYLSASAPVTNVPITLAGWGYFSATSGQAFMSNQTTSGDSDRFVLGASNNNIFFQTVKNTPGGGTALTTATYTADSWQHIAGYSGSTAARSVLLNGENKISDSGSITAANSSTIAIGSRFGTSWGNFLNGRAAEVAVWNVDLTDAEVASLSKGFKPYRIRPQNLVFYAPLIRNINDTKGARAITNNNTATVAVHPRVI